MRLIKLAVISVLFFGVILTLISLLIPRHIRISRGTNILADKQQVARLIRNTSKWNQWHPLMQKEENLQDFVVTILQQNDTLIRAQLSNKSGTTLSHKWQLHTYEASDSSALFWTFEFDMGWTPWKRFSSIFYDKAYGGMIEQGLQNLKVAVEQKEFKD